MRSFLLVVAFMLCSGANAQINFGEKALGALQKGVAGFTFSDADAAALSKEAVVKLDAEHTIAGPKDAYAIRLNRIFGKFANAYGKTFNYKVYIIKEINAFATADGSVRVYSGLMDVMDDNELLVVIGHEMGHVVNHDSRDAMKAAFQKQALIDGISSQSATIESLSQSQLGQIGSAMIDSKHSRKQESEADTFAYDFMKENGYNVNAVESAFGILAKMSQGAEASFLDKMMSSHPDSQERSDNAKKRAISEGVYKQYVHQVPVVKTVAKKVVAKKKTTKK